MKPLSSFSSPDVRIVLTDIDGTLTDNGRLPAKSYQNLERLRRAGFKVIPVTGRPAGWCDLIARQWPVDGVVGENGGFYFRLTGSPERMRRHFARSGEQREHDRQRLEKLRHEILARVPDARVSEDQFSRMFDLAIDFAEDVAPLGPDQIALIVDTFQKAGATAKVSNIHVNGWFGNHDKVSTCRDFLSREFGFDEPQMKRHCAFVGDSPNDEPMFGFFPHSFAVANIRQFADQLTRPPMFVAAAEEAAGFDQVTERLLALQTR